MTRLIYLSLAGSLDSSAHIFINTTISLMGKSSEVFYPISQILILDV